MYRGAFKNIIVAVVSTSLFFLSLEMAQRIRYWRRYDSRYWLRYGFGPRLNQIDYYKLQLQGVWGVRQGGIVKIPRTFYNGYSKFNPDYPHTEFRINSLGFRKPEFIQKKPDGAYRIVAIGDSVTFGLGVDDDSTFPVFLQKRLQDYRRDRNIEVLNLGIPSYTSEEMKNLIKSEVFDYSPDMIVIYGFFNDIYYSKIAFKKDSYIITILNSFLLDHSVFYLSLREKLCKVLKKDIGELYRGSVDTLVTNLMKDDSILDNYEKNIEAIIEMAKGHGVPVVLAKQALYLMDIKLRPGIMTTDRMKPFYDRFYSRIDEMGQENSINIISANERFENLPDAGRYFTDGTHLTRDGNELLASIVFDRVKEIASRSSQLTER